MKNLKRTFWLRLLTAQIPGLALLLILLSGEIFRASLAIQISFALCFMGNILLNLYFIREAKKAGPPSILAGQIFFTLLTFGMFLLSLYRYMAVKDDFQKTVPLLVGVVLLALTALLAWGIHYAGQAGKR